MNKMATIIKTIDLAKDVKKFVTFATVKFDDKLLKNKIFGSSDDDFLLITKSIDSDPKIIGVDLVDDSFISKAVLGENANS